MMNKKALSPLVATILLIAFAIALGVVVMNWGKAYIEEKAEFTGGAGEAAGCSSVILNLIQVSGKDKICYNPADNSIDAFIENGPDAEIYGIQARIVGTGGIETVESVLKSPLAKSASAQVKFNYPANVGVVQQVKFTPVIRIAGEMTQCAKESALSENIAKC